MQQRPTVLELTVHSHYRRFAIAHHRGAHQFGQFVGKLFSELGPRFKDRPGGYLRILKTGTRPGDAAPMAIVMLTEQAVEAETAAGGALETRVGRLKTMGNDPPGLSGTRG